MGSSLDRVLFQADSLVMFSKGLALLLVLSWIILTGPVSLENVHGFGSQSDPCAHNPTWSAKPDAVLTDDTVEPAGHTQLIQRKRVEPTTAELVIGPTSFQPYFKLHKVHHVFLI
jgi:hypothetical protein